MSAETKPGDVFEYVGENASRRGELRTVAQVAASWIRWTCGGVNTRWYVTESGNWRKVEPPPAEDPVPVGSRWEWRGGNGILLNGDIIRVNVNGTTTRERDGTVAWPKRETIERELPRGWKSPFVRIIDAPESHRLDGMVLETWPPSAVKCAPTCGPAKPCLETEMCRERNEREKLAYVRTRMVDGRRWDKLLLHGTPPSYRLAPPEPMPSARGGMVGVYRYDMRPRK